MSVEQQRQAQINRLTNCLGIAALAVEANPIFTPIFERLDAELTAALEGGGPVDRVRAMIRVRKLVAA